MTDKKKSYTSIQLSTDFAKMIDETIEKCVLSFDNRSDFFREAIRYYIRDLHEKNLVKQKK